MARDFQAVETAPVPLQNVALVGDIYTKYCSLGNWDLTGFLERQGCRVGINGLTWYALYYLDSHLEIGPLPMRLGGKLLAALGGPMQRRFIRILREAGFTALPPYRELKALARELNGTRCALGSGWLLAAESAAWVRAGYRKVLSGLPFQCLPGHIYGRGQYAALQRQLPGSLIVGVDYDASLRDATVDTRVRMLLDTEL
jgi:predicted nucleotide-binding protein (sugar kinase/HSP70/actin superfamily)